MTCEMRLVEHEACDMHVTCMLRYVTCMLMCDM